MVVVCADETQRARARRARRRLLTACLAEIGVPPARWQRPGPRAGSASPPRGTCIAASSTAWAVPPLPPGAARRRGCEPVRGRARAVAPRRREPAPRSRPGAERSRPPAASRCRRTRAPSRRRPSLLSLPLLASSLRLRVIRHPAPCPLRPQPASRAPARSAGPRLASRRPPSVKAARRHHGTGGARAMTTIACGRYLADDGRASSCSSTEPPDRGCSSTAARGRRRRRAPARAPRSRRARRQRPARLPRVPRRRRRAARAAARRATSPRAPEGQPRRRARAAFAPRGAHRRRRPPLRAARDRDARASCAGSASRPAPAARRAASARATSSRALEDYEPVCTLRARPSPATAATAASRSRRWRSSCAASRRARSCSTAGCARRCSRRSATTASASARSRWRAGASSTTARQRLGRDELARPARRAAAARRPAGARTPGCTATRSP